jgi:hypothetical protein
MSATTTYLIKKSFPLNETMFEVLLNASEPYNITEWNQSYRRIEALSIGHFLNFLSEIFLQVKLVIAAQPGDITKSPSILFLALLFFAPCALRFHKFLRLILIPKRQPIGKRK